MVYVGMMDRSPVDHVLFPAEAEAYICELTPYDIGEIGSERWSLQRERLEKLNLQAVFNLSQHTDDFVKDFLLTHEKLPVLVHQLLAVELWKERVLPLMLKNTAHPSTGFPCYLVLYHEATLVSLLEATIFEKELCESLEDGLVDLVDYLYRKISLLLKEEVPVADQQSREEVVKELIQQNKELSFGISVKAISLLRYITDHLEVLPLGVITRLLNVHDTPCLLVSLLESAPWIKYGEGDKLLKYAEDKWVVVGSSDKLVLTKTEGQVWLALYQLLMSPQCHLKYDLTISKKNHLLKLRACLVAPVLEQIPALAALQRYLQHLSLVDPPAPKRELVLEQVPVIYEKLLKESDSNWNTLAVMHGKQLMKLSPQQLRSQAKRWVDSYNLDILETLVSGPPKCVLCGREASKRCSRCRNEWYCGRECQVKHWKKHKTVCDVMATLS